jgi:ADP-heptose:LPS heptosyltransferase
MQHVPGVNRIAVLRANALGDYLQSLPALESLRAAYPEAEIVLLGAPWHAQTLTGRPGPIDRVLVVPAVEGIREPVPDDPVPADQLTEFLEKARGEGFDLALQIHGGGRNSNPFVTKLGARVTAGLRAAEAPPLDRTVPYRFYQPEVFRYLEVVGLVGAPPVAYRPQFALLPNDRTEAARVAAPDGTRRAVVHPGASDTRRRWPAERFAQVATFLAEQGLEVLVTGTPSERDLVAEVCAAAGSGVRPVVGELTIGGLAALLDDAAVVMSNDTGPLHLAAAMATPTVGLFWVGNMINFSEPERTRFRPLISWVIHCPRCGADCTRDLYPERGGGSGCAHRDSFMADIPVAEAVAELRELIEADR